jgi:hypothetical protein
MARIMTGRSVTGGGSGFMASSEWLVRYRPALYPIANVVVLLASVAGAAIHDIPFGVVIYACLLFALCSAPLLFMKRLNDRYALLGLFMSQYFLFFGALDLQNLLLGTDVVSLHSDFLSSAELAILVGAAAILVSYQFGVVLGSPGERRTPVKEWPVRTLLFVGTSVWLLGTTAMIYFQLFVIPTKTGYAANKGLANLGPMLTFIVMLGHMMQPLGILILAYGYSKSRHFFWYALVLFIVLAQVVVGFIEDIKLQAMMGAVLVIMVRTLTTNRLPTGWLVGTAIALLITFPYFQAYRSEVTGARGLDREQAFNQIDKVIDIVLASQEKNKENSEDHHRSQTFVERASSKSNMEILFDHVGKDVPFLNGRSLIAIPMAFVPRLLVPDKEDISVGMLFAKQILKSDGDVYISISHLGEMYWNFGWAGVIFGMSALGLVLGYIGTKFNLEREVTLTRVLVLLVTAQPLCLGFGGTMPVSYLVWMRSMAAVGLMHLVFARVARPGVALSPDPTAPESPAETSSGRPAAPMWQPATPAGRAAEQVNPTASPGSFGLGSSLALPAPTPRFPNLLR